MLLALTLTLLAQPMLDPDILSNPAVTRPWASTYAFFEAFPVSGAGTSGACSTTAPTGAKGEVLTFTRASNGTCTKGSTGGLRTTGIADGDLVVLSTNVARVEYDSSGYLGLLVEAARTNVVLRSEEFDNASWTKTGSASVWANDAGAPDGTQTADAIHFPAIGDAAEAVVRMSGLGSTTSSCSVFLRSATPMDGGVAVAGSIDLAVGAGADPCATCSYVPGSWTRCVLPNVAIGGWIFLGNETTGTCAAGGRDSKDVLMWGAQCEVGAYATSYIPTAGVAVARAAETASFPVSMPLWPISMGANVNVGPSLSGAYLTLSGTSVTGVLSATAATTTRCLFSDGTNTPFASKTSATVSATVRAWCSPNGTSAMTGSWDGAAMAFGGGAAMTVSRTVTGVALAGDSILSRICIDPSPTRCAQ